MLAWFSKIVKSIRITNWQAFFVLLIVGIVVYGKSPFSEFLFDDEFLVLTSNKYHSLGNIPGFFFGYDPSKNNNFSLYYRPIAYSIETINYFLFQDNYFFYRLQRMFAHIGSSYFFFLILRKFIKTNWSLLGALLFLVLPINIEAVMWTLDGGMLFFLFGSAALACVMHYSHRKYALPISTILMACSILTKEAGYLFIPIALLYIFLYDRKLFKSYGLTYIGLVVVTIGMRNVRLVPFSYSNSNNAAPINTASIKVRLLTIPTITSYYLTTFFFPKDLAVAHHWVVRSVTDSRFIGSTILNGLFAGLFAIGAIMSAKSSRKNARAYLFFFFWFLVGLTPSLQIIPLTMTVADRWFYMSAAGLVGMILVFLSSIKLSGKLAEAMLTLILIMIIGAFSVRTIIRIADWQNGYTLYAHDLLISPESHQLENNLAAELAEQGRLEESLEHLKKANELFPSKLNWINLATVSLQTQDYKGAIFYYGKIAQANNDPKAYEQIAYMKLISEGPESAITYAKNSITFHPKNAGLWTILALSEYKLENYDAAIQSAIKAYTFEPSDRGEQLIEGMRQRKSINLQ